MTLRPQPWHADARRLAATEPPTPILKIAEAVGKSATQVYRVFSPAYGEAQRAGNRRWMREVGKDRLRERYHTDPEFRRARLQTEAGCRARRRERMQEAHR